MLTWLSFTAITSTDLHLIGNSISIGQELCELLGPQNIPQCCLGNIICGGTGVLNIEDRHDGIADSEEDDRIYFDCDAVLGQNLGEKVEGRNIVCNTWA